MIQDLPNHTHFIDEHSHNSCLSHYDGTTRSPVRQAYSVATLLSLRHQSVVRLCRQARRRIFFLRIRDHPHSESRPRSTLSAHRFLTPFVRATHILVQTVVYARCLVLIVASCIAPRQLSSYPVSHPVCLHIPPSVLTATPSPAMPTSLQLTSNPSLTSVCDAKQVNGSKPNVVATTSRSIQISSHKSCSKLSAALINCRSMNNKSTLICDFIISYKLDLLFITESWLKGDLIQDDAVLQSSCPAYYSSLSWPRCAKKGGGLVLIYQKSIMVEKMPCCFTSCQFEIGCVLITVASKKVFCVIVYRPPQLSAAQFVIDFSELCSNLIQYDELLLLGDFNLVMSDASNPLASSSLSSVATQFDFVQHVTSPTHEKGRAIDLIFTRASSTLVHTVTVTPGISDHSAVYFLLCLDPPSRVMQRCMKRSYRFLSSSKFMEDLFVRVYQPPLAHVTHGFDIGQQASANPSLSVVNAMADALETSLRFVLDSHAPMRHVKMCIRFNLPWWSPEIRALKRISRKAER